MLVMQYDFKNYTLQFNKITRVTKAPLEHPSAGIVSSESRSYL